MKSPTGSVKSRGKGKKLARITWTVDAKCGKAWPNSNAPCPWCKNRDLGDRKRKERQELVDGVTADARDLTERWRKEIREHGTIIDRGFTEASSDAPTVNDLCDLFEQKNAKPPEYKDGKKIAGMKAWQTVRGHVKHLRTAKVRTSPKNPDGVELGTVPLSQLSFGDLYDAKLWLLQGKTWQDKPRSAMYVNRVMSTARLMLKVGRLRNLMTHNPFSADPETRLVDKRSEKRRRRVMTYEEEAALLNACTLQEKRLHVRYALIMAVETGMRQGEILATQRWPVKDEGGNEMPYVDWTAGAIHVTEFYSKTGRARVVPMSARLMNELRQWEKLLSPSVPSLFCGFKTIDTAWRGAKTAAGVKDLRFHDLKHTATTRLIQAGIPGDVVSMIVDHADPDFVEAADTTRRVYLNFDPDMQRMVVSKMNESWSKVKAQRLEVN